MAKSRRAAQPPFESLYRHGFARVAVATPRVEVASPGVNVSQTLDLARQAARQHAVLAVFPELCITGYGCGVVFAFHGYQRAIHEIVHRRPRPERFHVRGFVEEGTPTTPFDMVVLNDMSRYHLVLEALRRAPRRVAGADELEAHCHAMLERHHAYVREHLEDMPEVRDWSLAPAG